jgi:Zn-dependent peptidase ImmA (M78 family)
MEEPPHTIIDSVRALMPTRTLYLLKRPLTEHEARIVAERQAALLLELLDITKPSVEIELIAELPNIEVEVIADLGLSGASDWINDHWLIQVNASESLWRCRATLAHEIKHVLDDPFREELYPHWPHRSAAVPPRQAEAISDYFAGCVLVPSAWLRDAWQQGRRNAADLARLFDVSEGMLKVRLRQTGLRTYDSHRYTRRRNRRRSSNVLLRVATASLALRSWAGPNLVEAQS